MINILINIGLLIGAFTGLGMMAEGRPFGEWIKFSIGGVLFIVCVWRLLT